MKHSLPPLDTLKAFEAAARHLSFSLAADELCITKGSISYHIKKLENHLQCALFTRRVRQVYLTEAGQTLLQTVQQSFLTLSETVQQLQLKHESQHIRIAVSTYVAVRWLSRCIAQFNATHPAVSVVFQHSVNEADFRLDEVDMAVRWGACRGADRSTNHVQEGPLPLFAACSPALLKRLGVSPNQALPVERFAREPLNQVPLLCEDRAEDLWVKWYGQEELLPHRRLVISDANVRVQAAVDAQGWILADAMMQHELDTQRLVSPFQRRLLGYGYVLMSTPKRVSHAARDQLLHDLAQQLIESFAPC